MLEYLFEVIQKAENEIKAMTATPLSTLKTLDEIHTDLVAVLRPRRMTLVAAFTARGGITTNVTATYSSSP